ncbi:malonyl-CoA-acyl carrier protein transacylase, mitochondrial [Gallus gallus]|uniref:Malonyl-CoA-acyl carrier protein transacylase, mitochondrial n=1 Tax=Gallus gallus TaxID=9031 RepID=A0A1D5PZK7_CHICK|nr:malonyl-CoA-acyl carrier protein transacylase, mitochondrial [Gallus gallus]XP_040513931.1 malonyl-CoA-acyl carrier protein transacylase, mitochondrial [Gallus gallus]|eukprot:XP_015146784.1 malonyl-CoA-acyl carrier protein transacylase, mitochondrial [Gallus gallus]
MGSWAAATWRLAGCSGRGVLRGAARRRGSSLRGGGERAASLSELLQSSVGDEEPGEGEAEGERRERRSPREGAVLLFPGQGSQFVGMGRGLLRYPGVRDMYRLAEKVLGYDLLSLCLEGPRAELDRTRHCQPAVFVASLAAVEKLNHLQPKVVESCVAAAGYSVGEFAALVFAGAMDFAEALYAVKVRAEAMQAAAEAVPSGMLSVIGGREANYKYACLEARRHCESLGIDNPVCEISNYLFPDSRVIAGHIQALEFLQKNAPKFSFTRTKMLPVSGAFHTRLMEPAVEPLAEVLKSIEIQKPLICVYSNVDSKKYMHSKHIQKLLVKQLVSPVLWEQTMHSMYQRKQGMEFPYTYEVGPGKQLGAVLRKCNLKAWRQYSHVDVTEEEEAAET